MQRRTAQLLFRKGLGWSHGMRHSVAGQPGWGSETLDFDVTLVFPHTLERNFNVPFPAEAVELLSPLYQQDAVLREQVIESKGFKLPWRIDAIKIDVIEVRGRTAIFVDQSKRGTGDIVSGGRLKRFGDSLHQCRLPCAQVSAQQDDSRSSQHSSQLASECDCFFRRMCIEFPRRHAERISIASGRGEGSNQA